MKKSIDKVIASEANLLIAVLLFIAIFFVFLLALKADNWNHNKFFLLANIIVSAITAFGDYDSVDILSTRLLLFRGTETGIRAKPGFYFTFWFWRLSVAEGQSKEKFDLEIPSFRCQDKKSKVLKSGGSGRWKIREDSEQYKLQDAKTIPLTLVILVQKTAMRLTATLLYRSDDSDKPQIMGEDLGEKILIDDIFTSECEKLGIEFTSLILDAIAENLEQENINSYTEELIAIEKSRYREPENLTHEQLEDIRSSVQVQIGRARKIITDSPILGRYDIDSH